MPPDSITPKALCNPKFSSAQGQPAVQRELRLKQLLEPNDVADATGVALCHYYSLPAITGLTA